MKIPNGMTEEEVLEIFDKVANGLASKFKFGYHDLDDMKQQARILCIEGVERYDDSKGTSLFTFLWTHTKNRLSNFKRDKFQRPKPCLKCPLNAYDESLPSQCSAYTDKSNCDPYKSWESKYSAKKNLMSPIEISSVRDERESGMKTTVSMADMLDNKYLIEKIDDNIPLALRADWIKLKNGVNLKKSEKEKLFEEARKILEGDLDG